MVIGQVSRTTAWEIRLVFKECGLDNSLNTCLGCTCASNRRRWHRTTREITSADPWHGYARLLRYAVSAATLLSVVTSIIFFPVLTEVPYPVQFGITVTRYNVSAKPSGRVAVAADVKRSVASGEIREQFNCGHKSLAGTLTVPLLPILTYSRT